MSTPPERLPLRQCALAVSVLADVDLLPRDDGVLLTVSDGTETITDSVHVSWAELAGAVGDQDPLGAAGQRRALTLLTLYRTLATRSEPAADVVHRASRLLALPPGHALHPGPEWVRGRVRGGALDLGIGVLGLGSHPDDAQPLPPGAVRRLGLHPELWWPDLLEHAERMGELSARRIGRDGRRVLRPFGGCDALTLLSSGALRESLAAGDGTGLRAVAAPTRRRAWFDLAQVDPAFVGAVWSLTEPAERGLPVPLLVTRDEVVAPRTP
ncbi:MAG TPA: hypothetical protein VFP72_02655 [Kineosporiaceae bacterium]|nr:hypothetical protein [Kineosporiaceae bacterium]